MLTRIDHTVTILKSPNLNSLDNTNFGFDVSFFKIRNANVEGLVSSILCSLRLDFYFLAMHFVQSLGILCCALCIRPFLRSLLLLVSLIRNLEFEAAAKLKMPTSLITTGAGRGALLPSRPRMEKEYQWRLDAVYHPLLIMHFQGMNAPLIHCYLLYCWSNASFSKS